MGGLSSLKSLIILVILNHLASYMNSCSATRPIPAETNAQFIKTACGATTYPELCFSTLSSYALKIQTSPKLLATMALSVTITTTRSASTMVKNLSKAQGLKAGEAAAIRDCIEELNDSVQELKMAMREMGNRGGKSFGLQMNDIQTWVSAALPNEATCMDGFADTAAMGGDVKATVRRHIVHVAHMTSNALALINNYAITPNSSHP